MIKYIDLFAGIGGFHQALKELPGFECVFASDIDKNAREIYFVNHGIQAHGDITLIDVESIPRHNLLLAGFPCQPFSKGGNQLGFEDLRGTLFFNIARIIDHHKPEYILLENVSNIINHDNGKTSKRIIQTLKNIGYITPSNPVTISPHDIGVPVHRPRAFFIAIREDLKKDISDILSIKNSLTKFEYKNNEILTYFNFSEIKHDNSIKPNEKLAIDIWDEFIQNIKTKRGLGFPIWYDFFQFNGSYENMPKWKEYFIKKNIQLYTTNKAFIDAWSDKHNNLVGLIKSHRKFEWQCGEDYNSIYDGLIQFRPSGIRIKRLNYFSTLVAINQPQIIGPLRRRLTLSEAKQLQSLPPEFILHEDEKISFKQLGNSINVKVIQYIIKNLLFKE